MEKSRIIYLTERYMAQATTPAELEEFFALVRRKDASSEVEEALADLWLGYETPLELAQEQADFLFANILRQAEGLLPEPQDMELERTRRMHPPPARIGRSQNWRLAAAAILLLVFAGGAFYWYHQSVPAGPVVVQRFSNDIPPGGNKAVLRLSSGQEIVLNDATDGRLAAEKGARIEKQGGAVVYVAQGSVHGTGFNDISTPVAGQYKVVLADGTKVWLDAASNIHFPAAFTGPEREVSISGQAYFEVAPDRSRPFKVRVKNQTIEVLGTHFNVNAYDDEAVIRTTLAEGKVRVTVGRTAGLELQPGEQAAVDPSGTLKLVKSPDMEETLAWKEGMFEYNGADIGTIMREVARWYGVHILYKDKITEEFVAEIPRTVPVSQLLLLLEATRQVHFTIEGKTITVTK